MIDKKYGPWALVIGGSEGIGRELVLKLAADGINVAFTARKQGPLDETSALVAKQSPDVQVRSLSQDITAVDMVERIDAFTRDIDVGMLIYNAGAMNRVPAFLDDTVEGHLHTIRLNCEGPVKLAHHFGSKMRARGGGGIMMMSSVSALVGAPRTAVYGATKSFDMLLCEGLWYEFKEHNIDVLCMLVGSTDTPAHDRMMPGRFPNPDAADDVAQQGLDNMANGPVYYVKSVQPQLDMFLTKERRALVTQFGDYCRDFYAPREGVPEVVDKRFDEMAPVG